MDAENVDEDSEIKQMGAYIKRGGASNNMATFFDGKVQLDGSDTFISAAFDVITKAKNNIEDLMDAKDAGEKLDKRASIIITDSQRNEIIPKILGLDFSITVKKILEFSIEDMEIYDDISFGLYLGKIATKECFERITSGVVIRGGYLNSFRILIRQAQLEDSKMNDFLKKSFLELNLNKGIQDYLQQIDEGEEKDLKRMRGKTLVTQK